MGTPIPANRAPLDARTAAEVTGGRVVRAAAGRIARGLTTDSRSAAPGCAFVALRGRQHDGHAFVGAAVDAGAILLIVERGGAPLDECPADVVEVDDTLVAWGALARAHLRRWRRDRHDARCVAITGSAGKTTTKEICAALLGVAGGRRATVGNLNNRVGMPAVALSVEGAHRFAVLELGMSEPGEIALLSAIAEPDVGVVTNVGMAHAGGVGGTIGDVAREKGALFAALRPGGIAVANADDPAVLGEARRAGSAVVVTFGSGDQADYRLVSRQPLGAEATLVGVRRPGRAASTFRLPLPGAVAAVDFVAAIAAAEAAAGIPLADSQVTSALAALAPLAGRMQVRRLRGDVIVVDDTYNASPDAVRGALGALAEIAGGRRVAVLGEMRELGPSSRREHEALGAAVADAGVALLVCCGGLAEALGRDAERRGVTVFFARDAGEAAAVAVDRVRSGDTVLVKASRSVGAERVVEALARARGECACEETAR